MDADFLAEHSQQSTQIANLNRTTTQIDLFSGGENEKRSVNRISSLKRSATQFNIVQAKEPNVISLEKKQERAQTDYENRGRRDMNDKQTVIY